MGNEKRGHLSSLWKNTTDSHSYSQVPREQYPDIPSPLYKEFPSTSMANVAGESERPPEDSDLDIKPRAVQFPSNVEVKPVIEKEIQAQTPHYAHSIAETDDGEDDEDYDWSTDEDLVDQEAKFDSKFGKKPKKKGWGPKRYVLFNLKISSS
jgi:hypothetical protein